MNQGYGYPFWRSKNDGFRGDGAYGQFTIVLPKQSAVLAIHAECRDRQGVLDRVWQHLLAGMKDEPLAAESAQLVLTGPTAQHSLQVGLGAWWRGRLDQPHALRDDVEVCRNCPS